MGGVISAIVDAIVDVVEVIVDIVETVIDLVVDIVDSVIDTMADLLGFDQDDPQTIEQFQVHNQALFENPDTTSLTQIIYNSIMAEEDIAANILYAEVFQSGKKNVRKFTEFIDDDNYFEDFPTLQANIITVDYDEVDDVLTTLNSTPVTIDTAKLGTLFVPNWIKYWLQVNKSYDHNAKTFVHSSYTYTVNVYDSTYNSGNSTYTLRLGNPLADFAGFTVPAKPIGLHYIIYYHKDNAPSDPLIWIYKVGEGTYTDLDEPSQEFGESGSDTMGILPAIPLRINNTNFNATATTKSQQITDLVEKVGLDAPELISSVMDDVADAGISDYNNKVDHVFLNFGVRLWDTSQIAINYCFRFVSTLYPGQASTEGDYNAAPDDKPYNTLLVTGSDYKYTFRFAYIKFVHTALAAIDADATSTAHAIYYSDLSRFTSGAKGNDDLIAPYYISSGVGGYNVGYYCSTTANITSYLAGSLAQESSYSSEAAEWMQPTQRIEFTGTLVNADDSTNSDGVVKPSLVYEKVAGGNVTQITSNTTYQIPAGTSPLKIEISGGGGGGGSGERGGSGSNGNSGGTTYARVYNAGGTLLNTYTAGGGGGGAGNAHETSTGFPGQSFGGPGSNGVPSGAHSSFSGTGGQNYNDSNGGSASGYSAGGASGGDDGGWFHDDDSGNPGLRGTYYTVNHTVANYTDYVVITIGGGGAGGQSGNDGGNGSAGRCVLTPTAPVNTLRLINRAAEETTVNQEMIYYQATTAGLNAYTLKAPKCLLRVVDAQTGEFKMVSFNLAEKYDLMIPFSYDMVKDLPNAHVSSLFIAAAHVSLYVAHYEVIETPLWAKLLKIVQVVLFIIAVMSAPSIAKFVVTFIKEKTTNDIMQGIFRELGKGDDKLSAAFRIVSTAMDYGDAQGLDLTKFSNIFSLLGDVASVIGEVLTIYNYEELDDIRDEQERQKILQDKKMDALHEVQQALFQNKDGVSLDLTRYTTIASINPMSPSQYLSNSVENFNMMGFNDWDYNSKYDSLFEPQTMIT